MAGHRQDAGGTASYQPAGLFHGGRGEGTSGGSGWANQRPLPGAGGLCPAAAVEGLFENRTVIVIPLEGTDLWRVEEVERLYRGFGSKIVEMDPDKHDMSVAYVSHISHISSFALALTVLNKERDENITNLAAGGFDSTARLAKSGADMWEPILATNIATDIMYR